MQAYSDRAGITETLETRYLYPITHMRVGLLLCGGSIRGEVENVFLWFRTLSVNNAMVNVHSRQSG